MEKFKPGQKVRVIDLSGGNYPSLKVGDILTVRGCRVTRDNVYSFNETKTSLFGRRLELVEPEFNQNDLEIGMVVLKNKDLYFEISEQHDVNVYGVSKSVNKIFKYDDKGDLIKIWEREKEKLYYLVLPGKVEGDRYYNQIRRVNKPSYNFSTKHQSIEFKTKFTAEEIKYLPNQNLIACLEQEDVNE